MATAEQLAQALTELRQQLAEAQRPAMEAQRARVHTPAASTRQVDPRVMMKCPTFSGRDTEWSESVAATANLETAIESEFTGWAENPFTEFTPEMRCETAVLSPGEHGQETSVDPRQKPGKASRHRSMENASRPSTSQTQLDGTQRCLWGSCSLAGTLAVR